MFSPAYRDYANVVEDRANQDYSRAQTHTISGYVRTADGAGIPAVTLSADNGGGSGVTNAIGYYSLTVLRGWSGRVTPAKSGYVFSPKHRDYASVVYNRTNRNYSGQWVGRP